MSLSSAILDEINLLSQFDLSSMQAGIKVHSHSASKNLVDAAARLHNKGIITQADGGYLTNLGLDAARHAQGLLMILNSK